MRECDITLEVDCPPERFWALYFDDDFNRDTFLYGLRWSEPTIVEFSEDEREILRVITAQPRLELGPKVSKMISETLGYREQGRFDKREGKFRFRNRTNIFGDRMELRGEMWAEPLGDDRMRWRSRLKIECSIFGVGGIIERVAEYNALASWPMCSNYWNRWLKEHPQD
ncbi:MAG: DUF2505 family protein [Myxococcales bacterium]|nr:DUF2505 family protein [Myxococcales bacterium]MCA9698645.1 DUF2505 family protein [Myxococcales bacterium]